MEPQPKFFVIQVKRGDRHEYLTERMLATSDVTAAWQFDSYAAALIERNGLAGTGIESVATVLPVYARNDG